MKKSKLLLAIRKRKKFDGLSYSIPNNSLLFLHQLVIGIEALLKVMDSMNCLLKTANESENPAETIQYFADEGIFTQQSEVLSILNNKLAYINSHS